MGYQVYFGADEVPYDTLKHTLVIDEVLGDRSTATVEVKNVTTITGMMPVKVACNTTSSLTFGGVVRNWSVSRTRASEAPTYQIEIDDWQTYFDRHVLRESFSSVAIDSIIRTIVYARVGGFNSIGVNTMACEARSLTWDKVTVTYDGTERMSDLIDSLVAMQTPPDPYDPPAWRILPDRIVKLVGAVSSLGPTVTVDDSTLDLVRFEMQEVGTEDLGQVSVYGGFCQTVYQCNTGQSSIAVYNSERFWGVPPFSWTVGTNTLYLLHQGKQIPVINVNTTNGYLEISTIDNNTGSAHGAIAGVPDTVQAFLAVTAPAASLLVTSAVTGATFCTGRTYVAETEGWGTNPLQFHLNANSLLKVPGQELGMLRMWTMNSEATAGGRLVVSLTAAGARRGVYPIRRVRISGFGRGETIPPVYEIEAGADTRYRVDSLL